MSSDKIFFVFMLVYDLLGRKDAKSTQSLWHLIAFAFGFVLVRHATS